MCMFIFFGKGIRFIYNILIFYYDWKSRSYKPFYNILLPLIRGIDSGGSTLSSPVQRTTKYKYIENVTHNFILFLFKAIANSPTQLFSEPK